MLTPAGLKALQELKQLLDYYLSTHCYYCSTKLVNGHCPKCKYAVFGEVIDEGTKSRLW